MHGGGGCAALSACFANRHQYLVKTAGFHAKQLLLVQSGYPQTPRLQRPRLPNSRGRSRESRPLGIPGVEPRSPLADRQGTIGRKGH